MTALRDIRRGGVLTREDIGLALRQYAALYGEDFPQSAFAPSQAKRNGRPELVERYYAGRQPGEPNSEAWISLNGIKSKYDGSWNAARIDAGLPLNTTGPTESRPRRKPGEAEPILNVRERRVVTNTGPDTTWLKRQLDKANRRAERLAAELDAEKALRAKNAEKDKVESPREIELRKRLADETHRRKDVQRELHNAVRRENRARASSARSDRRADVAALREVDRLTQRLVEAQDENRELRGRKPRSVAPKAITKTKTRTITKTVKDPVALRNVEKLEAQVSNLRTALSVSEAGRVVAVDRLATLRRDALAAAAESQKVQSAERRVAGLEDQLKDLTQVLIGARRILNEDEVEALRKDGPAGRPMFTAAVLRVSRAYGDNARKAALWDAISAARNWIDRL